MGSDHKNKTEVSELCMVGDVTILVGMFREEGYRHKRELRE